MQNINSIKNYYILRLIYSLGGMALIYQVIKYQIKNFKYLLRNWKFSNKPQIFNEIIQQNQAETGTLQILNQQIIYGRTKQQNFAALPLEIQQKFQFLALKKQNAQINDPCFLIIDSQNYKVQVTQCSNIRFSSKLYQKVQIRDQRTENQLKKFGYNKIFFANLTEYRIKFGTPIIVIGDLIFNKNTKSVRCFKQHFIGDLETIKKYLQIQTIKQSCLLLFTLFIFSYFAYDFYRIHKKKNYKCSSLSKIFISKGNDSLQCQECKKQLIDTFFSPCGHFNLCNDCAKPYQNCPNCGEYVEETVRTFKN
ncbi:unnamed protein product [Paramecium primaurelia]|uniref:RING-type domain-containing protein n=1 Tax=Paramecium primaurelia TaxID=5886 RepID=A0A8S1M419_PARPR|nr:unnamed protein product [Paramecium primaurelia]